jgi:hypothetical protein
MHATDADTASEVQSFRHQARIANTVVKRNLEGLTHEESLVQPQPGGNCLNWIVGHLVWAYAGALPLVGQKPMLEQSRLSQYARGAAPMTDPAQALDFGELVAAWEEGARRMDSGLADFPSETLGQPAPGSPTNDPNETIRSLLATIMFHQAYHVGQTGVLRRLIGKPGAIK